MLENMVYSIYTSLLAITDFRRKSLLLHAKVKKIFTFS